MKVIFLEDVKGQGKKVESQSLIASGSDAFFDAIISAGTSSLRLSKAHPSKDRDYYVINLKEPAYHDLGSNGPFANIKVNPMMNLSTSGDYEKCFRVSNELGDTIPGGFYVYHPEEDFPPCPFGYP